MNMVLIGCSFTVGEDMVRTIGTPGCLRPLYNVSFTPLSSDFPGVSVHGHHDMFHGIVTT